MARLFAKIGKKNIVENVIVAEPDFIATLDGEWIECGNDTGKRRCAIGFIYSREKENFHTVKPYPSWKLDENCDWKAPKSHPNDGKIYDWDEVKQKWVLDENEAEEDINNNGGR